MARFRKTTNRKERGMNRLEPRIPIASALGVCQDEPSKTRVVGFRIIPFLPKKNKKKKTKEKTNEV